MWKTIIYDIPGDTRIRIQFLYFDNEKSDTHSWGKDVLVEPQSNSTWLNDYIWNTIARFETLRAIPLGEFQVTEPVVDVVPVDVKLEEKTTFNEDFRLLKQMQAAMDAGLLTKDDPDYTTLKTSLETRLSSDKITLLSQIRVL